MREIKLYGALAKFVGKRRFLAEVSSAGEAIRMLLANFPKLERHMTEQHYKVIVDNSERDVEEINYPASGCIQIVPVIGGAGGVGKIIAGVALIAVSVFVPAAAFGLSSMFAVGAVGASLVLGGVAQLLSPTPQLGQFGPVSFNPTTANKTTENTEQDPQASYSFSGIQNVSRAGVSVPLVYGETFVGSVLISAGIDVDNI